jgi:hypothetical protein
MSTTNFGHKSRSSRIEPGSRRDGRVPPSSQAYSATERAPDCTPASRRFTTTKIGGRCTAGCGARALPARDRAGSSLARGLFPLDQAHPALQRPRSHRLSRPATPSAGPIPWIAVPEGFHLARSFRIALHGKSSPACSPGIRPAAHPGDGDPAGRASAQAQCRHDTEKTPGLLRKVCSFFDGAFARL